MGHHEGAARPEVRLDLVAVDPALDVVRNDHHQDVGLSGYLGYICHPQACGFCHSPALALWVESNNHILAVVFEVEGMGVALAAVTNHADRLALKKFYVCILVVINVYHVCFIPPCYSSYCTESLRVADAVGLS